VPLVNTTIFPENLAADFAAGGITDPNAVTVFGRDDRLNYGAFSGMRLLAGGWLTDGQTVGLEASGFVLGRQTADAFSAFSTGSPILALPLNSVTPGQTGETARAIAGPFGTAVFRGAVQAYSASQLWGADGLALYNLCRGEFGHIDAVGGFKYLGLNEDLVFAAASTGGGTTADEFIARNDFYGGELGARLTGQWGKFGVRGTGTVALGATHQALNINGFSLIDGQTVPGGFLAVSSNSGKASADRFSVVPQLGMALYYDVTCHVRLSFGYQWLYWNNVLRPGNEFDRTINTNLVPIFGGGPGGAGPQAPARLFQATDLWAQGLSFGLAVQY
jgi:hypothetical protein